MNGLSRLDRRSAMAARLANRFSGRVASLWGVDPVAGGYTTGYGNLADGHAGESSAGSGNIMFDKNFLRTASKSDLRGAVIHELTHTMGVKYGKAQAETAADYSRYMLNPHEAAGWSPSEQVLAMAQRRGDTVGQPNGPRAGSTTGRNRNTVRNNASKNGGYMPAVSPSSALSYGNQTAQARYDLLAQIAALRAQRAGIVGDFNTGRASIREDRLAGETHAANASAERGLTGSSIDMAGRAQVLTDAAEQMASLRSQRSQALQSILQQRMGYQSDYYRTLADIAAQRATEKAGMAANDYQTGGYGMVPQQAPVTPTTTLPAGSELAARIRQQKQGYISRTRRGIGFQDVGVY